MHSRTPSSRAPLPLCPPARRACSLVAISFAEVPDAEGMAFGIMGIVLNIGMMTVPLACGAMAKSLGSYNPQNLLFAGCFGIGVMLSVLTWTLDHKGRMNAV